MYQSIFSVKHSDCPAWVRYLTLDQSTVARWIEAHCTKRVASTVTR